MIKYWLNKIRPSIIFINFNHFPWESKHLETQLNWFLTLICHECMNFSFFFVGKKIMVTV